MKNLMYVFAAVLLLTSEAFSQTYVLSKNCLTIETTKSDLGQTGEFFDGSTVDNIFNEIKNAKIAKSKITKLVLAGANNVSSIKRILDSFPNVDSLDFSSYSFTRPYYENYIGYLFLNTLCYYERCNDNSMAHQYYAYHQMKPWTSPIFLFKNKKYKYVKINSCISWGTFFKCTIGKLELSTSGELEYQAFYGGSIDTLQINRSPNSIVVKEWTRSYNEGYFYAQKGYFDYYNKYIPADSVNQTYCFDKTKINVLKINYRKQNYEEITKISIPFSEPINKLILNDCEFKVTTPYFKYKTKWTQCDGDTIAHITYDTVLVDSVKTRTYSEKYSVIKNGKQFYVTQKIGETSLKPANTLRTKTFQEIVTVNQTESDSVFKVLYQDLYSTDTLIITKRKMNKINCDSTVFLEENKKIRYYLINKVTNFSVLIPFSLIGEPRLGYTFYPDRDTVESTTKELQKINTAIVNVSTKKTNYSVVPIDSVESIIDVEQYSIGSTIIKWRTEYEKVRFSLTNGQTSVSALQAESIPQIIAIYSLSGVLVKQIHETEWYIVQYDNGTSRKIWGAELEYLNSKKQ